MMYEHVEMIQNFRSKDIKDKHVLESQDCQRFFQKNGIIMSPQDWD